MSNFTQSFSILLLGIVAVAAAGFVPHGDEFGRNIAGALEHIGLAAAGGALTLLLPQSRVVLGGERSSDSKTEGRDSGK